MRKMIAVVQAEIEQLDALEPGPQAVEQREAFMNKVGDNRRSVFEAKHSAYQLLSVTRGTRHEIEGSISRSVY